MYFLFQRRFFLLDQQEVLFRVFADSSRVDVLVIRQRAFILARPSAKLTRQTRFGMRPFVGSVGRKRLILRAAHITLRRKRGQFAQMQWIVTWINFPVVIYIG